MQTPTQSASIRQLLVLAYVVITIPAIIFVVLTIRTIDYRVERVQTSSFDASEFTLDTDARSIWLIRVGEMLRGINAPFSKSPELRDEPQNNHVVALSLSDIRTAMIYLWLMIFLIGASAVMWLGVRLNRPLTALTESIGRLARDELVDPVEIAGPRNVREMGNGLDSLRKRLKDNDMQQSQFLRHISHEVKTPLTSIKEGSQLLDDELLGPLNEDQREITEILKKSTLELQTSIENLLNYSSAISIDKIKQRQIVDLSEVVNSVLDKQALPIKKKNVRVKLELSPTRAFVDRYQIQTVFDNLVSNAVKFSPSHGVIEIWLKREDKAAVFTIRDDGPGIPEKHRKAIFNAFFVGTQSEKTTLKGTGLGLSIARQYVELHNGTIELMNTRKGATFQVTFNK